MLLPNPKPQMDPGDSPTITEYLDGLVLESATRRRNRIDQASRNYNLYLGNHWLSVAPDESERYVYNRIKTILIAHAAIQNGTKASSTFNARESGERPLYYINFAGLQPNNLVKSTLAKIDPRYYQTTLNDDGTKNFPQPLPSDLVATLQREIADGQQLQQQAAQNGLPAPDVIPDTFLVAINDYSAAEALQTIFDAKWDESQTDFFLIENSLLNGIIGWQHLRYCWDKQRKCHDIMNAEYTQVFVDSTRTDISIAADAVDDEILGAERAMAKYPELADIIRRDFQQGTPQPAGTYLYQRSSVYENYFIRNMGTIRHGYVRDQRYPVSEEDAVEKGLVAKQDVPIPAVNAEAAKPKAKSLLEKIKGYFTMGDEKADGIPDEGEDDGNGGDGDAGEKPSVSGVDSDSGEVQGGSAVGDTESQSSLDAREPSRNPSGDTSPQASGSGADTAEEGEGVADADENAPPDNTSDDADDVDGGTPLPTRTAYFLVDPATGQPTSTEVKPWDEEWPWEMGIRHIKVILGVVVADNRLEYGDIPLPHNVNFPIIGGPWGQGTPEDLESLQMAVNAILSDIVVHHNYNAFPQQIIPESVNKKFPKFAQDKYIKPGTPMIVPDDLIRNAPGGKFVLNVDPPQNPPDSWKMLQLVLDLMDKGGEMAQVITGQVPAGTSGEAFNQMQTAAQNSITFRAKRMETMVKYLTRLMVDAILKWMTPEDMAEIVRGYDMHVWYALHRWIHKNLQYDLVVETSAGGGISKSQKNQQILNLYQTQAQPTISPQTAIEAVNKDPDTEQKQIREWQQQMAPPQPLQVGAPQSPTPAPSPQVQAGAPTAPPALMNAAP